MGIIFLTQKIFRKPDSRLEIPFMIQVKIKALTAVLTNMRTDGVVVSMHMDRPGMIGRVGTILGEHRINIASMHVGRMQPGPGGHSVMVLALDGPVPPDVLEHLRQLDGIETAQVVEL